MSVPKYADGVTPERLAAMGAVRDLAVRKVGDRPGFDCLLGFLSWEQAGRADPGLCWSLFLQPAELMRRFRAAYDSPKARRPFTLFLLEQSLHASDEGAVSMAYRIAERMLSPRADGAVAWPLLFLGASEHGVAAVIAIHDEFWTENWVLWVPPSSSPSG